VLRTVAPASRSTSWNVGHLLAVMASRSTTWQVGVGIPVGECPHWTRRDPRVIVRHDGRVRNRERVTV